MTGAILLLAASIVSLELIRGSGVMAAFRRSGLLGRRALHILTRMRASDWAKERALRLVSLRLLMAARDTAIRLLIVAAPLLAIIALDRWRPLGVRASMTDWPTRLWLLALTCLYALARRALRSGQDRGERLLQRVALGSRAVLDSSFAIERRLHPARAEVALPGPPVFIAGLARAGTSILTRLLHETGEFASLTYRDLPFPLAPNSWARLTAPSQRHIAAQERGHGDGLLHDLDSPEAIEELFWLSQEGERYRRKHGLLPVAPLPQTVVAFHDYARLIRTRYGKTRYLSKNNNNILRLPALVAAFPDAMLVHPFRDPVEQSRSLLNQHLRALDKAREDPYRRQFMTWLGHHEFGADHRPFLLGDLERGVSPTSIDYWLLRWGAAYRFLLDQPENVRGRQIFLDYDALCTAPANGTRALSSALRLETPIDVEALRPVVRRAGPRASKAILAEAYTIYGDLLARKPADGEVAARLSA